MAGISVHANRHNAAYRSFFQIWPLTVWISPADRLVLCYLFVFFVFKCADEEAKNSPSNVKPLSPLKFKHFVWFVIDDLLAALGIGIYWTVFYLELGFFHCVSPVIFSPVYTTVHVCFLWGIMWGIWLLLEKFVLPIFEEMVFLLIEAILSAVWSFIKKIKKKWHLD